MKKEYLLLRQYQLYRENSYIESIIFLSPESRGEIHQTFETIFKMKTITRRQFLGNSTLGILAVSYFPSYSMNIHSSPFDWPLSFQSYGVREMLAKDFEGTMQKMRGIGYKGIEMCSPKGYENAGFGPLTRFTVSELRRKIEDADLFCISCHFQHPELKAPSLQNTIQFGKDLGLKDLVVSAAWLPENASLDDWKKFADEMNRSGEEVQNAGMQLVYHNHSIGPELNGEQLYDILMRLFDPKLIKMQFQIASVSEGFDVVAYIAKYPGRYISLHMHDWDPKEKKIVAIGKGIVDWKKLLTKAKEGGLSDYGMIVEMETRSPGDPLQDLAECYQYLQTLKF
jgi:sugar phosphate isomerase/epimerase